jgi:uncharacterized protein (TIGR02594 family)
MTAFNPLNSFMLPDKYQWLLQEPGPKMIVEALKIYGTKEIVGKQHNQIILSWAKELGLRDIYLDDETPWCGLAHAYVAYKAGKSLSPLKGWDLLRALQWAKWGVKADVPMFGDTLVFKRGAGMGHVGLYTFETANTYGCMGGNSGNEYKIVEIEKSRLVAARRPVYKVQPDNVRRIFVNSSGEVSTNEA